MTLIFQSKGHLQNGVEVYDNGTVIQGSERLAYCNGGNAFSEYNRSVHHIPPGCSQDFNTTSSFNSLAPFTGVKVSHHSNGVIEVIEIEDADEYYRQLLLEDYANSDTD